jgi:hypothetical protein
MILLSIREVELLEGEKCNVVKISHILYKEQENTSVLRCNSVQSCGSLSTFRMNELRPSSGSEFKSGKQAAIKLLSNFSSVPTMEEVHSSGKSIS